MQIGRVGRGWSGRTPPMRGLIIIAAVCLLTAGCGTRGGGSSDSQRMQTSDQEAVATLVEGLSGAWNVADRVYPWRSFSETLPMGHL
jgi:hypothetical protein